MQRDDVISSRARLPGEIPSMTSIPVLLAMRLPDAFVARLSERYRLIGPLERSAADALPPEAREARALLTMGSLKTDAAMIEALPALELICCYGTGFEGVDRAHAAERGIRLANAGSANAAAVADYAIGLILGSESNQLEREVTAIDPSRAF
jgi:lactate dehydrogenase-like 2-hydroxyacid dehydrogenase